MPSAAKAVLSKQSPRLKKPARLDRVAPILLHPCEKFVVFLWLLGPAGRVSGSRAEDTRIILPPAAVALELVGIAA